MTDEERQEQKGLHTRIRADAALARAGTLRHTLGRWAVGTPHRTMLLLWGFVRGFPYRRIERSHRVQVVADGKTFEHNMPSADGLAIVFQLYLGGDREELKARLASWLVDPSGAIPAPPPRAKKPYVAPASVAAE